MLPYILYVITFLLSFYFYFSFLFFLFFDLRYSPLVKKMREFQEHWQKPIHNDWDIVLTCGAMEGCSKVLEMVLEIGDPMMVQVPTYDGILGMVNFILFVNS